MSGGSYDYAYSYVEDMADSMDQDTPMRRAFAKHLKKVAKAMHDIEWVDSCDYGEGDDEESIRAVISDEDCLRQAIEDAKEAQAMLKAELDRCEGKLEDK